jgi:hypothetical protein
VKAYSPLHPGHTALDISRNSAPINNIQENT